MRLRLAEDAQLCERRLEPHAFDRSELTRLALAAQETQSVSSQSD